MRQKAEQPASPAPNVAAEADRNVSIPPRAAITGGLNIVPNSTTTIPFHTTTGDNTQTRIDNDLAGVGTKFDD